MVMKNQHPVVPQVNKFLGYKNKDNRKCSIKFVDQIVK